MGHSKPKSKIVLAFTAEQMEEQRKFLVELEAGTADIVFEGSALEAKAFLKGVDELVVAGLH